MKTFSMMLGLLEIFMGMDCEIFTIFPFAYVFFMVRGILYHSKFLSVARSTSMEL